MIYAERDDEFISLHGLTVADATLTIASLRNTSSRAFAIGCTEVSETTNSLASDIEAAILDPIPKTLDTEQESM